jgi:hypothetical protein
MRSSVEVIHLRIHHQLVAHFIARRTAHYNSYEVGIVLYVPILVNEFVQVAFAGGVHVCAIPEVESFLQELIGMQRYLFFDQNLAQYAAVFAEHIVDVPDIIVGVAVQLVVERISADV